MQKKILLTSFLVCVNSGCLVFASEEYSEENNMEYYDEDYSDDVYVYEGEYIESNHISGDGIVIWKDGKRLEGTFKNGKPYDGTMILKNGDVFEGCFDKDGNFEIGILKKKNGDMYEGEFLDNKPYGKGKWLYKDGSMYVVNFKFDKKTDENLYTDEETGVKYKNEGVSLDTSEKGVITSSDGTKYNVRKNVSVSSFSTFPEKSAER